LLRDKGHSVKKYLHGWNSASITHQLHPAPHGANLSPIAATSHSPDEYTHFVEAVWLARRAKIREPSPSGLGAWMGGNGGLNSRDSSGSGFIMPKRHDITALQAANHHETMFPALRTGLWDGRAFDASEMCILVSPGPAPAPPWVWGKMSSYPVGAASQKALKLAPLHPNAGRGPSAPYFMVTFTLPQELRAPFFTPSASTSDFGPLEARTRPTTKIPKPRVTQHDISKTKGLFQNHGSGPAASW
jgi:hypothetical protein